MINHFYLQKLKTKPIDDELLNTAYATKLFTGKQEIVKLVNELFEKSNLLTDTEM